MTDSEGEGWKVVQRKEVDLKGLPPAQREKEEIRYMRDWEKAPGNWSGSGKHVTNAKHMHAEMRPDSDLPLGIGAYGHVDAVSYRHVSLARKRIFSRRMNIDQLREEAHVMERLDHSHIVRLVGTYSVRRCEIYLLLWPVAVCTLADFLDDLNHLRAGTGDRDDIVTRMRALDLKDLSAVEGAVVKGPERPGAGGSASGNCPLRFLQKIMGCLAQALAHVHDSDVRHLDLKPSNILLNPGRVYVADFGIARGLDDGEGTMTVGGRGTKKWRAPETWDMENKWSMQAVDVYALGLVYLAIATVLYRSPYYDYDDLLSQDPDARPALLADHLRKLAPLALASPLLLPHASRPDTIATARPVLEVASRMLAPHAPSRPRARDVDTELVLLGGIEQVYHGSCCRKSNTFVALCMDEKHGAACAEGRRFKSENERLAREVEGLRRDNEAHHHNAEKDRRAMKARVADEVEKRKKLEERVAELERLAGRRKGFVNGGYGQAPAQQQTQGLGLQNGTRVKDCGPAKKPTIPRPQAHPVQRNRPSLASQLHPPSEPALASAPLHTPAAPATLTASFSSVAARGTTPMATAASSIPLAPAAAVRTSPSPSPNGYGLRSRNSTSRLPLPITPRTSTPGTPGRDPTDSTQTSISSSIFSRRSLETLPTPVTGTPVVRVRQGTLDSDAGDMRSRHEGEEQDEDEDDDGSVLWTTLPEKQAHRPPPTLRTWSSIVSEAPTDVPRTPRRLPDTPDTHHRLTEHKHNDSLTEVPYPGPSYGPASPSLASPGLAPVTPISPSMSAQSSPRLSRAEVASVSSAGDGPRGPPTLSPMKSWAEVAGDAVGRTMMRIKVPPARGPSSERGDVRHQEGRRSKTPTRGAGHLPYENHHQQSPQRGHRWYLPSQ